MESSERFLLFMKVEVIAWELCTYLHVDDGNDLACKIEINDD